MGASLGTEGTKDEWAQELYHYVSSKGKVDFAKGNWHAISSAKSPNPLQPLF